MIVITYHYFLSFVLYLRLHCELFKLGSKNKKQSHEDNFCTSAVAFNFEI